MIRSAFFASLLLASSAFAADAKKASSFGRSVYYPDGSHMESVQDMSIREQTETLYSPQGVKIARRVYLLNEQGLPVQGNVYDGRDQLKARAQFLFDEFGRLSEQRMLNLQGEVFQRVVFSYDANGKQLPPKSYNYNVKAPEMKQVPYDFTKPMPMAPNYDRSQMQPAGQAPAQQGNVPYLPDGGRLAPIGPEMYNGGQGDQQPKQDKQQSKEGFFKRLFKKKDGEKK